MSQITTHVLDTARGKPAKGLRLTLARRDGDEWIELGAGVTDADGRVSNLLAPGETLPAGRCKLTFDTGGYHDNTTTTTATTTATRRASIRKWKSSSASPATASTITSRCCSARSAIPPTGAAERGG